ncbi:MAG: nucleotidyltransferase domain-containing protein [Actinomycetota bacterium]|nr:nucleotidyltransferase domain-containing protein [Actinomycetota bacterium]
MKIYEKYRKAADEFARRALEGYGDKIDSIILFGSVARGEPVEESDIDILVVAVGDRFRMRRELSGIVLDMLLETGEYLSVKTLSVEDFKFLKEVKSSFLSNVIKEGVFIERGKVIA